LSLILYRLTSAGPTSIQLPTALLDNPNFNCNNNFDGVLDADTCSLNSFSNDDSSDMETFSDVELTDHSDDEAMVAHSVYAQGCADFSSNNLQGTFLTTTITKIADEELAHQEIIRNNNLNNNNNGDESERASGRSRRDLVEEEFSFKSSKQDKAKPQLPEVSLLQGLELSSISSPISQVVEHIVEHVSEHECDEDCDCMSATADRCGMYSTQAMQAQNSF